MGIHREHSSPPMLARRTQHFDPLMLPCSHPPSGGKSAKATPAQEDRVVEKLHGRGEQPPSLHNNSSGKQVGGDRQSLPPSDVRRTPSRERQSSWSPSPPETGTRTLSPLREDRARSPSILHLRNPPSSPDSRGFTSRRTTAMRCPVSLTKIRVIDTGMSVVPHNLPVPH